MTVADFAWLVSAIEAAAQGKARLLVAIAGPPGSGKSTLADRLAGELARAVVLPMDGFHLANADLSRRGMLARKGAPDTFDVAGFAALVERIAADAGPVPFPTFDRAADRVVSAGGTIRDGDRIVLAEGNYLLLDAQGWRSLAPFWDISFLLEVPEAELERRLIRRWLDQGLDLPEARRRARENDLVNARVVRDRSIGATARVALA